MNGFFRITFTGAAGSGLGMLVLHDGVVVGADVGGAIYDGTYTENSSTQTFDVNVTMHAPAGITPVQTGIALVEPRSIPISCSISLERIETEIPSLINTPIGPVNILFKKIRDF